MPLCTKYGRWLRKACGIVSQSLSLTERKYSQLEKEGLTIIFGVKKFHDYVFSRKFSIFSDHRPRQQLFSECCSLSPLASACIQRWALTLTVYEYTISYKKGEQHSNADALSRLSLPEMPSEVQQPAEIVLWWRSCRDLQWALLIFVSALAVTNH